MKLLEVNKGVLLMDLWGQGQCEEDLVGYIIPDCTNPKFVTFISGIEMLSKECVRMVKERNF